MNNEKLSMQIYNKACASLNADLKKCAFDQEMIKCCIHDFNDIVKVALLVKDGYIKKAFNKAFDMDTAARDDIHENFWKLREKLDREEFDC
jgi:hypothetical protein